MPEPCSLLLAAPEAESDQLAIVQVLLQAGFSVRTAASAAETLRFAADGIDLVLLALDGPDLCAQLKSHPAIATVPVIELIDGNSASEHADAILTRPVRPVELLSTVRALLRLRRTEHSLYDSEERFRQITETIRQVFWITQLAPRRVLFVSPAYEDIWGRSCASLLDQPESWREAIHPDDRERIEGLLAQRQPHEPFQAQYRLVRPDGGVRWIWSRSFPVADALGKPYRLVGLAEDVTENRRLAEQFRQAQKMEAIGRLAGGVAHDFNNLLTAIAGYADLAQMDCADAVAVARHAEEIHKASERGSALTRQLLAYSRQQVLAPRVLNLNAIVADLEKMLRRLISADVALVLQLDSQLRRISADAGQVEQVLMNLVVNACDAMPHGGTMTIRTSNTELDEAYAWSQRDVQPGAYALLEVHDTGCGMTEEVRARLFEPFFTTKEVGKGTGLGLSTVYGIVRQSGGHIEVESAPGQGATFKIYLPQAMEASRPVVSGKGAARPTAGSETILLVEDEAIVRDLARVVLQRHGYRVLVAGDGSEALQISEQHAGPIHLLLSDVVMPHLSGPELAKRLLKQRPSTRVLFMSGYTGTVAETLETPHGPAPLLHKPFAADALAREVRAILDRSQNQLQ
jgi:PAS domain S-box-containing protein